MFGLRVPSVLLASILFGASAVFTAPAAAQDAPDDQAYVPLAADDLQQLAAPVALYPDALLAQVLVACTYPDDVAAAVQYLDGGNDPNAVDDQGWDLSVSGVAHYPDVLHYMASNADWMNQLGSAFLNQESDVMAAVQTLRGQAMADGNLVSNDQQQVISDDGTIEIVPTDPQTIYPPVYDWHLVYEPQTVVVGSAYVPLIRFGPGIRCGAWLHHDLDWHDHSVYVGNWGADRPWWHHAAGGQFDYTHDRPGISRSNTPITVNIHNQTTTIQGGQWNRQMHDVRKPMPKISNRPVRSPDVRPGAGYAPKPAVNPGQAVSHPSAYNHGSTVIQQSNRGKTSLGKAGIRPAAPAVTHAEPAHVAPPAQVAPSNQPVRHAVPSASVHSTPQPPHQTPKATRAPIQARPSAPVRGGAVSGYTNGATASHASARGSSSRTSSPAKKGH